MKLDKDKIDVHGGGIWISGDALEEKFNSYTNSGYASYRRYKKTGDIRWLTESARCHAKAGILWDIISYIDEK